MEKLKTELDRVVTHNRNYTNYYLFLSNRTPFAENTSIDFVVTFYINYVAGLVYLVVFVQIASWFLTMGWFFNTFRTHFELMFQNMSNLVGKDRPANYVIQLKSCLVEAINFHIQVKE